MHVEIIEGADAFRALREDWIAVYDSDPEAQFFLSYDWLFGTRGGPGHTGLVLAARAEGPESPLVAFTSLRCRTQHGSEGFSTEFGFSGNYVSDYNGFICRPEYEDQAIPAMAELLKQMTWGSLRFLSLAASSRRAELFMNRFSPQEFGFSDISMVNPDGVDNGICPFTLLSSDWDDFLQTRVSSNTRQKIRRYMRQVEGSDVYRITHTDAATLERDMDLLIELWTQRWGKRKGKRLAAILDTNRRMLKHAFMTGTLFMPVLWHGDRAICALAILVDQRKGSYNFLIGGRDEAFQDLPAGLVMHGYAIRHAIAQGMVKYDFLRGNEPYKYSFGAQEFHLKSVLVEPKDREACAPSLDARSLAFVLRRSAELWREKKPAEAARGYDQVLEIEPHNTSALYLRGLVGTRVGDHAMAASQFRALLDLRPESVKVWFRLGQSLAARGEWAEVVETFRKLLARNDALPRAWFLMGRALYNLKQYDEAFSAFDRALRLKKDYPDAQRGYLLALRRNNESRALDAALRNRSAKKPATEKGTVQTVLDFSHAGSPLAVDGKSTASAIHTVMAASAMARRRVVIRNLARS